MSEQIEEEPMIEDEATTGDESGTDDELMHATAQEEEQVVEEPIPVSINEVMHDPIVSTSGEYMQKLELRGCDPGFDLKSAITGPKRSFVRHIEGRTSSKIQVKGEQSEAISIEVTARTLDAVGQAVGFVKDLLDAVREEYDGWRRRRRP